MMAWIPVAATVVIVVGLLVTVAGLYRERRKARAAHRDELAAMHRMAQAPQQLTPADIAEQRRAREWRASFDAAIADVDARFAAIAAWAAGPLPTVDPEIGPEPVHVELVTLAVFAPAATLDIIREDNAAPPVWSWTTAERPFVPPPRTRDRRRLRRYYNRLAGVR